MPVPVIALAQWVRLTVVCTQNGQQCQNVGWFVVAAAGGASLTLPALLGAYISSIDLDVRAVLSEDTDFAGVLGAVLHPVTGVTLLSSSVTTGGASPGDEAGPPCPSVACPIIRKSTGMAGRSHQGRFFGPPLPASKVDVDGEVLAAFLPTLNAYAFSCFGAQTLTVGADSVSLEPRLKHSGIPLSGDEILTFAATGRIGSQHRRGDYGRTNPSI